jgi:hypothetical protein
MRLPWDAPIVNRLASDVLWITPEEVKWCPPRSCWWEHPTVMGFKRSPLYKGPASSMRPSARSISQAVCHKHLMHPLLVPLGKDAVVYQPMVLIKQWLEHASRQRLSYSPLCPVTRSVLDTVGLI